MERERDGVIKKMGREGETIAGRKRDRSKREREREGEREEEEEEVIDRYIDWRKRVYVLELIWRDRVRYRCKVKRKKDRQREGGRDKEIDRYGVRESVCIVG